MECFCCKKQLEEKQECSYGGHIYCPKHYQQMIKYGHCLDNIQRTTKDLNDFEYVDKNTVMIHTYNQKCEYAGSFIIDASDLDLIIDKKWRIWRNQVFTGNFKPKPIYYFLFSQELENNKELIVDHINSNRLDNRRSNLRIVTQAENALNKQLLKNNTSGVAGVIYDSKRHKWAPEICYHYKRLHLGRFDKFEDAVYARYIAEKILFGEYRSFLNDAKIKEQIKMCQNKKQIRKIIEEKINRIWNVNSTH